MSYYREHTTNDGTVVRVSKVRRADESQSFVKPAVKLIGEDGNIFNLMAIAQRALEKAGLHSQAEEMCSRIRTEAEDYDHALCIIAEYVDIE